MVDSELAGRLLHGGQGIRVREPVVGIEGERIHPAPFLHQPRCAGGVLSSGEGNHAVALEPLPTIAVEDPGEQALPLCPAYAPEAATYSWQALQEPFSSKAMSGQFAGGIHPVHLLVFLSLSSPG